MPPRPYTSEGKGQAVAPPQPDFQPRRALWTEDYVAGGAWASLASYVRSLPLYQDPLSRDFPAVYEQMPLDPVVQASTRTIKLAVLADDITPRPAIDDADDPDYELAAELTDFMSDVYAGLARPIDDLCYELLDGVFVGHRVAEKVGKIQEGGPHSGFLVWDRVNVKPRHNTAFVLDAYSNLVGLLGLIPGRGLPVLANAVIDSTRGVENLLPREKFLVFSWNMKDNDPRGQPLYRACYEPWWHKQQVLGQWLKFLGQTAVPSLFATTPEGADFLPLTDALGNSTSGTQVSQVQQLLNQLLQFQGGTAMAAPFGTALKVIQAAGDGSVFTRRIEYADNCIARVLTLQTLATIEARHGTRAQAEVHQDSLDLGVAYVRRCLARVLTEDLHRPLIRYNWGEDVARRLCPYASLTATAPQDRTKVLPAYAAVGYTLAPEQYAAVDEELGLPVRAAPPELPPPPGDQPGAPSDQPPPAGNGSDQVASADNLDAPFADDLTGGRWVTIEGEHVYIRGGQVVAGPPALKALDLARQGKAGKSGGKSGGKLAPSAAEDYQKNGTRSKAFKAWFGDWEKDPRNASKVVDPQTGEPKETHGEEPKVVYHGRKAAFESFDFSKTRSTEVGLGAYFAEDRRIADTYAAMGGTKGDVLTAYLSIKKPFNFDAPIATSEVEGWSRVTKEMKGAGPKYFTATVQAYQRRDGNPDGTMPGHVAWSALKDAVGEQQVNKVLEKLGYDGITHTAMNEAGVVRRKASEPDFGRVWVAFQPTQIKAKDNTGTFDPSDPRVAFSDLPAPAPADAPFYSPDQARDESGRWALGAGGVKEALSEARNHAQEGEKALRRSAGHEKRALSLLKNDDPARGRFWPVRREALAGTGNPLADLSTRAGHASRLASDLEHFAGEKESSPAPGEAKVPGHARNAAAAAREAAGHLSRAEEVARPAREEQARAQAVWQQLDGALEALDTLTYDFPRGGDHAHAADLERLESLADSLVSGGSDLSGQRQTAQALRQEAARLSSALSTSPAPDGDEESHRALVQSVRGIALRAGEADRLLSRLESYHAPRDVQLSAPPETPVPESLPPPVAAPPAPTPWLGEGNVYAAFRAYLEEATGTAAKSWIREVKKA